MSNNMVVGHYASHSNTGLSSLPSDIKFQGNDPDADIKRDVTKLLKEVIEIHNELGLNVDRLNIVMEKLETLWGVMDDTVSLEFTKCKNNGKATVKK